MKVEIGKRLKRVRLEKGFTQKGLAARVKGSLDYTYIGKIERGEQLPSLKILIKISEALAVPVAYFFQDEAIAAAAGIDVPELKRFFAEENGRALLQALQSLHQDDLPLLVEIVRVLNRQRKVAGKKSATPQEEPYLMAAESETPYGKS